MNVRSMYLIHPLPILVISSLCSSPACSSLKIVEGSAHTGRNVGFVNPEISVRSVQPENPGGSVHQEIPIGSVHREISVGSTHPEISVGSNHPEISVGSVHPQISVGSVNPEVPVGSVHLETSYRFVPTETRRSRHYNLSIKDGSGEILATVSFSVYSLLLSFFSILSVLFLEDVNPTSKALLLVQMLNG